MPCSLLIRLLFIPNLLHIGLILSQELYESPNVKTALFTELDIRRSCWNHEDINLLRARMIMQDLIPRKVPRDMPYLVEYLRSTEEAVIQHSPEGKVRKIMMTALSDVIGGYLQAVAIPMAKEAYYAGNIDYATMNRLYELQNEMKRRLRTDGGRWSRPVDMTRFSTKVTSLHLPVENSELACKAVFVIPIENCAPGMSRIAIPYLDYDVSPGAVALPLKSRNLYSLKTAASSHIIVRFYILARQCLSGMPQRDTDTFNYLFLRWMTRRVTPHLYEDEWYPGFGSVMRIVETVNETDVSTRVKPLYVSNDTNLEKSLISSSCGFFDSFKLMVKYSFWWLLLLLLAVLFLIFLLLCCCCWLVRCFRGDVGILGEKGSSGVLNAVLSIYCGLKDKDADQDYPNRVSTDSAYYNRHLESVYRPNAPPPIYEMKTSDVESSTVPSSSEDEEEMDESSISSMVRK